MGVGTLHASERWFVFGWVVAKVLTAVALHASRSYSLGSHSYFCESIFYHAMNLFVSW